MASEYTTNYGLCQWVPEDNFIRSEFNEDNMKIDAAIKAAHTEANTAAAAAQAAADRALADLILLSCNVYNLILQNHYNGKYSGYRKALLMDGFIDSGQIDTLTPGLCVDTSNRSLLLDGTGQPNLSVHYGLSNSIQIQRDATMEYKWTPTGNGVLTLVRCMHSQTGQISLNLGDALLGVQTATQQNGQAVEYRFSIPIYAGREYTLRFTNVSANPITFYYQSGTGFGRQMEFTPTRATSGTMTSVAYPAEASGASARAWVRHSGEAVGLSLQSGGVWRDFVVSGTRSTMDLNGHTCTETAFRLDTACQGPLRVRLKLSTELGQTQRVYDYGIAVL